MNGYLKFSLMMLLGVVVLPFAIGAVVIAPVVGLCYLPVLLFREHRKRTEHLKYLRSVGYSVSYFDHLHY